MHIFLATLVIRPLSLLPVVDKEKNFTLYNKHNSAYMCTQCTPPGTCFIFCHTTQRNTLYIPCNLHVKRAMKIIIHKMHLSTLVRKYFI